VAVVIALGAIAWHAFRAAGDRYTMSLRLADVASLTEAYLSLTVEGGDQDISFDDLVADLGRRGVRLANPLATDASVPSYRLCNRLQVNGAAQATVLVEETENVASGRYVVRSYRDGRTVAELK
jgi:hypothetical protein